MGKEKYMKAVLSLFERSPVVSYSSIKKLVKDKQYAKLLVHNLVKHNKIHQLTKGCYTKYQDPSLAVFCFKPAYLGLQDALSYHNLWEQETIPVIVTTRKVRTGVRKVMGANILIRRIDKKYFFGYDYVQIGTFYLPYSDAEKTLLDMAYFKENISKSMLKKIDKVKLKRYLKNYPKKFWQSFGFL